MWAESKATSIHVVGPVFLAKPYLQGDIFL